MAIENLIKLKRFLLTSKSTISDLFFNDVFICNVLEDVVRFDAPKIYGKTGNQSASSLKRTPDGGLVILGSNQQEKTNAMITLIKTDSEGNIWE